MQSVYSTAPADWTTVRSLGRGVLPHWRDAVGVFYSPSKLGHSSFVGEGCFTPLKWCSLLPQPIGPQFIRWEGVSYPTEVMQSVSSTAPADWATVHSLGRGVLPRWRDAVGVFYSPSKLGHSSFVGEGGSYPTEEMHSLYSTAPPDWPITCHELGRKKERTKERKKERKKTNKQTNKQKHFKKE